MKIMRENALYIQKIDLEFLKYYYRILPEDISNMIFSNPEINLDDLSKYDFLKIEDPQVIKYFQNVDAIIDYNSIENYSIDELGEIGKKYNIEFDIIARQLYTTNKSDSKYAHILSQYKELNYKIKTLVDIIDYKNGLLILNLPGSKEKSNIKKLINKFIAKKSTKV